MVAANKRQFAEEVEQNRWFVRNLSHSPDGAPKARHGRRKHHGAAWEVGAAAVRERERLVRELVAEAEIEWHTR